MTVENQDITIWAGTDVTLEYTVRDADGNLVDFSAATGDDVRWRGTPTANPALAVTKNIGGGITFPSAGVVRTKLTESDYTNSAVGGGNAQLLVTLGSDTDVAANGKLRINRNYFL